MVVYVSSLSKSKEEGKAQELIHSLPQLTQYTVWESEKNTRKHHIQESQEISPFPEGDATRLLDTGKTIWQRQTQNKNGQ